MIKIQNLTKSYYFRHQEITALKNITLEIKLGEIVGIVGPSGSGKTTLLNIIADLEKPDHGEIKKSFSKIGYIFQDFFLLPHLTVRDNILLPLKFHESPTANYEKLIHEVGLEKRQNHLPAYLSGGEKQRTAIARALITQPDLLLADEPTGNLDEATTTQILKLLKTIHQKHALTIILATHDNLVTALASRIIHLHSGTIKKIA